MGASNNCEFVQFFWCGFYSYVRGWSLFTKFEKPNAAKCLAAVRIYLQHWISRLKILKWEKNCNKNLTDAFMGLRLALWKPPSKRQRIQTFCRWKSWCKGSHWKVPSLRTKAQHLQAQPSEIVGCSYCDTAVGSTYSNKLMSSSSHESTSAVNEYLQFKVQEHVLFMASLAYWSDDDS